MAEEKSSKKGMIISIITLVFVAGLILMFGTYAYWQITRKQTDKNLVGSACLNITYTNETNDINIDGMWPTSDTDGSALVPYTFVLTNTCPDTIVNYTVALEEIKDSSNDPITYPDQYVSDTQIKIKFDDNSPVKISTLDTMTSDTEEDYEIYKTVKLVNRKLAPGASRTHSIRLWLDQNAPMTEMNKYFFSKVKIIAGQGIDEECYAVNDDGVLYSYDADCGRAVTIPASVNGQQVLSIGSNAFKGESFDYVVTGSADADSSNNPLSNINESWYISSGQRCIYEGSVNNATCQVDFSLIMDWDAMRLLTDEDYRAEVAQANNLSSEEDFYEYIADNYPGHIYAVIKYIGSDTTRISRINEAILEELENYAPLFGLQPSQVRVYNSGDTLPSYQNGEAEVYFAVEYITGSDKDDNGTHGKQLGYKLPVGTKSVKLLVDSVDLSQATNLETIEDLAFSNLTYQNISDLNGLTNMDLDDVPTGLTSLTFGNNTNEITVGQAAFAGAKLSNLTIYTSLQMDEINDGSNNLFELFSPFAFTEIGTLTVKPTQSKTVFDLGDGYDFVSTNTQQLSDPVEATVVGGVIISVANQTFITNLVIDSGITNVKYMPFSFYADKNGTNKTNITLPNSLTKIDNWAFVAYEGSSLPTIPNGVTEIGEGAFGYYVGSGTTLSIPSGVTTIGPAAFLLYNGSSLSFPSGLTTIGRYAFRTYAGSSITIPNSVTTIGDHAFNHMNDNSKSITVYSQSLLDTKETWAPGATVNLAN